MKTVQESTTYDLHPGNRKIPVQTTVTTGQPQASSVEIGTDAKGRAKLTCKVYDEDPKSAMSIAIALYKEGCKELGIEQDK